MNQFYQNLPTFSWARMLGSIIGVFLLSAPFFAPVSAQTPVVGVPCYVNGQSSGSSLDAFISINYTPGAGSSSLPNTVNHLATFGQVGSTWGTAYRSTNNSFYAASVLKRHSGYGPNGSGAIYRIPADQPAGGSPSLLINLDGLSGPLPGGGTATINTGDATDHTGPLGGSTSPNTDATAWSLAGKSSLGDLDISPDQNFLWVVNTKDRQLIKIDISTALPSIVMVYPVNSTTLGVSADMGEMRPGRSSLTRQAMCILA